MPTLLHWFKNVRLKNISISRGILSKKTEKIVQVTSAEKFTATDSWFTRCTDFNTVSYRKTDVLPNLLKDYDPSQTFNADKTGLFYTALPESTHVK